jgi:hypothetical protein
MARVKLSPSQRDLLQCLSRGPRSAITDESVVRALERKGLAVRVVERAAHLAIGSSWRITRAGRDAIGDPTHD